MKNNECYICGKELTQNDKGLCKKLLPNKCKKKFCIDCLATQLGVSKEYLEEKINEYIEEGCELFI